MSFLKKIFGTSSQREVKAIMPLVEKIEALEDEYKRSATSSSRPRPRSSSSV